MDFNIMDYNSLDEISKINSSQVQKNMSEYFKQKDIVCELRKKLIDLLEKAYPVLYKTDLSSLKEEIEDELQILLRSGVQRSRSVIKIPRREILKNSADPDNFWYVSQTNGFYCSRRLSGHSKTPWGYVVDVSPTKIVFGEQWFYSYLPNHSRIYLLFKYLEQCPYFDGVKLAKFKEFISEYSKLLDRLELFSFARKSKIFSGWKINDVRIYICDTKIRFERPFGLTLENLIQDDFLQIPVFQREKYQNLLSSDWLKFDSLLVKVQNIKKVLYSDLKKFLLKLREENKIFRTLIKIQKAVKNSEN